MPDIKESLAQAYELIQNHGREYGYTAQYHPEALGACYGMNPLHMLTVPEAQRVKALARELQAQYSQYEGQALIDVLACRIWALSRMQALYGSTDPAQPGTPGGVNSTDPGARK